MAESRVCRSCGTANEADARFCDDCGGPLARVCAACGVEARPTARFCRGCGTALEGEAAQTVPDSSPVRKTVTVMFADLAGSTSFEEQVDAETAREVVGRYHDLLRSTTGRHRAGVTKYIGDGFMAVWGVPEIRPDDASHAVDAAVELQERFVDLAARVTEAHGVELALRVAVNTGEVVVGAGDADLVGDALNVGARLESECPRGHVVVGEETWRATRGRYGYAALGQVQVKGRTAPVSVYQWEDRKSDSSDATPFVGRADELGRLQAAADIAIGDRSARLVTVIGDPGVGKSRLALEFTSAFTTAHSDAQVITARCVVEGAVALAPMIELLRGRDIETDVPTSTPERDRLLRALDGLTNGVAGSVEENFWALRRFIEVRAGAGPVVLLVDDIQWADGLLLDFIEHLIEWIADAPVLVLALARPELRELRPDLVTAGTWVSDAVHLDGLDASATAELAAKVLGTTRLPTELLGRLPSSTGGNPLFVRELLGMLAHDGVLIEEPKGWRLAIDVDAISIPPTIHALLASRLERLEPADRRVLEIASVVGGDFTVGAVKALSDNGMPGVTSALNRLRRFALAQPSGAYLGDEPVWRFHHVLIRDVAYRRLLKSDRADLHERFADWVSAGGQGVALDTDELIARHLELAHTYRRELGAGDDHTDALALRAARHYATAARRALARDELVSAGNQAARGAAMAAADTSLHTDLLMIGCEAFLSAGDVASGAPLVDDLEAIADDVLAPWATCYRCQFTVYTDPERLPEVDARLQPAIDEFARRRDHAGLAKAHRVRAGARFRLGRIGDGEQDLFEALIAARQSGDHRQITAALGAAPGAALWGPSPVPKAGGRCLDVVRMQRMTTAAPSLEATSLRHLAVLELLRGRPDKARTMLADARQVVSDLGLRSGVMETELFAGIIEAMEGDQVAAEPHFRTAMEGLDALGVGADAGQAAALLAKSVLSQSRIEEADRYAAESERLAGRNLKTAIAWRAVRAEILAAQGRFEAAASMAWDAVAVAAETDLVLDHAQACLALSRVLNAAGDAKGAGSARADADRLYAAKEVLAAVGRTVEPGASGPAPRAETTRTSSRLEVTNRSCEIVPLLTQYDNSDYRLLAVRGDRLCLGQARLSDDDGNESTTYFVVEIGDEWRVEYHESFDADDFSSAYRELERRYYTGEGAAFAESGLATSEWVCSINDRDYDRAFGDFTPGIDVANRSRTGIPDRTANELRATFEEFDATYDSVRTWHSAVHWFSPAWCVARMEREACGRDGEQYAWTRLLVFEMRDGRSSSACVFDIEDEDAAFAYAEERMHANASRLRVSNRCTEVVATAIEAMEARDADAAGTFFAKRIAYDDRRQLSGHPIRTRAEMVVACENILRQFTTYEDRVLAVRGEQLALFWNRWSDDAGNQVMTLRLFEIGTDGLIAYEGCFDEDDFEGAYRELEQRYFAAEGSEFAEGGAVTTEWMLAANRGDFDRLFGELSAPDLHVANRSISAFPDRTAAEFRATYEDLAAGMASFRAWSSTGHWLSPNVCVGRTEREAVGPDGEKYRWDWLLVCVVRSGRLQSMCLFDVDDEDAAFAYAEERVRATTSRLAVRNRCSHVVAAAAGAMAARDADAAGSFFAERIAYDDRRRLSWNPIRSRADMVRASENVLRQFTMIEDRVLAVRGERLALFWTRWSDEAGNEVATLRLYEIDDDSLIAHEWCFEEDDFESAYRDLEQRYYAGEGAAFAESGAVNTEWMLAANRGDFDRVFNELSAPGLRVENRSVSAFPDRTAAEFRATYEDLAATVLSVRAWTSTLHWLSPTVGVGRIEREAVGHDGENYTWNWLLAGRVRNGRIDLMCLFDVDDEESAFAYADEHVRTTMSRLAVTNLASEHTQAAWRALQSRDVDGAVACYAQRFACDDRRHLPGHPWDGRDELRKSFELVLGQYPQLECRTLAVRGQRLTMAGSRWSDAAGNELALLHVWETDDNGLITYDGRFDADDFEAAYRELEQRYYAGEGSDFAEAGAVGTEWVLALNNGDFERLFTELTAPDLHVVNQSLSVFGDPSAAELRKSFEDLYAMVASARAWSSAVSWVSPEWGVARLEREAVGLDGEKYSWARLHVCEIRDGRIQSLCRFEVDDEDAAFAYAQERATATPSRLPVTNRASQVTDATCNAMRAGDPDGASAHYADHFTYDDHRRLSGDPIVGRAEIKRACERLLAQYSRFETQTVAVRGDHLHLFRNRFANDAGYETTFLFLYEIDEEGRFIYEGRFDEGDFLGAYRELERRYYAHEGAEFADAGAIATDIVIAMNEGDYDRAFGELADPEMLFENRSGSAFPNRTIAEFRTSLEELDAMVASARVWHSAIRWVSPQCCVFRMEREATGRDGEQYAWTRFYASGFRDGRLRSTCEFEHEDAAFAYAEERARTVASRLTVGNRSSDVALAMGRALQADDAAGVVRHISDRIVYDDRRRISGNPVHGLDEIRIGFERILQQFNNFEYRILAVRGDRLNMSSSRWSDDHGNESTYLHVCEIDDDGLQIYEGRFDEDDFLPAYRELEERYYAGEGAEFADAGVIATDIVIAPNGGEASARVWHSAVRWVSPHWCVHRVERVATGRDGESHASTRFCASEIRDGMLKSTCEFEDEDAAFAYAEEQARTVASPLAIANRSSRVALAVGAALQANDADGVVSHMSDRLVYDDRRRISGSPVHGRDALKAGFERVLQQFNRFEYRILAVRGERLSLNWSRWSDDSGNQSDYLHVFEIGDDGLQIYEGRFDDDDFEGAYRELEKRYYAGEGEAFADNGSAGTELLLALNKGDFDRAFGELMHPDIRAANRSHSILPERSAAELRASYEDLHEIVGSVRTWNSALCWLSSTWCVMRQEREATGIDDERYQWVRLVVDEWSDGRLESACLFDLDDEESAFAHAEERVRATASRLTVTNRARETWEAAWRAAHDRDVDAMAGYYSDHQFEFDDRRRLGGLPIADVRTAQQRILDQYTVFDARSLAVRGERLHLGWTRWSNESGFETTYLLLHEVGDDGRIVYEGRFDEDDFDGAYRELASRYRAGEDPAVAEAITLSAEYLLAVSDEDFDRAFGELSASDMRIENRLRSGFPDRSALELRASFEELSAMVVSARSWNAAEYWLDSTCGVCRHEREAVGKDGELYSWSFIVVFEAIDGKCTGMCQFELDDEVAAFAYAEERIRTHGNG